MLEHHAICSAIHVLKNGSYDVATSANDIARFHPIAGVSNCTRNRLAKKKALIFTLPLDSIQLVIFTTNGESQTSTPRILISRRLY